MTSTEFRLKLIRNVCCWNASFIFHTHESILKISLATAIAMSPCPFATRSTIDPILRSFATFLISIPHPPCMSKTVPSATRERTIGSDSYFPHPTIVPTMSSNRIAEEDDGGVEDECMYELVFRMAVATESRTFLLFESAQALAHSNILREKGEQQH